MLEAGVIARTDGRNPGAKQEFRATLGDAAAGRPMIVLVDGLTELDAQARALALRAQIQLPPVTLPVATVGPAASAPGR